MLTRTSCPLISLTSTLDPVLQGSVPSWIVYLIDYFRIRLGFFSASITMAEITNRGRRGTPHAKLVDVLVQQLASSFGTHNIYLCHLQKV